MLSLKQPVKNYTCKYLESTRPVYAIVSMSEPARKVYSHTMFFTTPFVSTSRLETYNVMTTFLHKEHAHHQLEEIRKDSHITCTLGEFMLIDISYYAMMLHMPLMVIMNTYCNIDEREEFVDIFYTERYLDQPQDYTPKNIL